MKGPVPVEADLGLIQIYPPLDVNIYDILSFTVGLRWCRRIFRNYMAEVIEERTVLATIPVETNTFTPFHCCVEILSLLIEVETHPAFRPLFLDHDCGL